MVLFATPGHRVQDRIPRSPFHLRLPVSPRRAPLSILLRWDTKEMHDELYVRPDASLILSDVEIISTNAVLRRETTQFRRTFPPLYSFNQLLRYVYDGGIRGI